MEEINYKMDGAVCRTDCPYQKNRELLFATRVNSIKCRACDYFISDNERNHTVICSCRDQVNFNKNQIQILKNLAEGYDKENNIYPESMYEGKDVFNYILKRLLFEDRILEEDKEEIKPIKY